MAWHLAETLADINDGSETDMVEDSFLQLVFTMENTEKLV